MANGPKCSTCQDTGSFVYGNTAMGTGIGGQMMTEGPCPGTQHRPDWTDCPVVLRSRIEELEAAIRTHRDIYKATNEEAARPLGVDPESIVTPVERNLWAVLDDQGSEQ